VTTYSIYFRLLSSHSAIVIVFISILTNADLILGSLNLYDDFDGSIYNLSDGQISPNGKWLQAWTGYGEAGTTTILPSGNVVFYEKPKVSTSSEETHSVLTVSTKKWQNVEIHINVKTILQTRQNAPPNSWESAWVTWRYIDPYHHYYFIFKPNGIELGKKDNDRHADEQIFLYTANFPTLRLDTWSAWTIKMQGNHIQVYIDSHKVVDCFDNTMSNTLSQPGAIGLYAEDASAQFDNVYVSSLS
jgi:3-keto-disaccharide hydrolase